MKLEDVKHGVLLKSKINGLNYEVLEHHIGDVLFLKLDSEERFSAFHLFYDDLDDVDFTKEAFGIDLLEDCGIDLLEINKCEHEDDGWMLTSFPPKFKCVKCGEFFTKN
ncbi:MAG: hypothetical protein KBT03_13135 [Bacteroidales bacterium]|nr:hypothetical protein [Candidatus Scybalousia scybalohippi]